MIRAIPDDGCDRKAMAAALRAARALPPYRVARDASSTARTSDTTDRLTLVWRSARVEFGSLGAEPGRDATPAELAVMTGDALEAALADATTQAGIDDLMRAIERTALILPLIHPQGRTCTGMGYAQAGSPFGPGHAMRSTRPGSATHVVVGGDEEVARALGTTDRIVLVRSARMEDDVAVIVLQAAGAVGNVEALSPMERLRLVARYEGDGS